MEEAEDAWTEKEKSEKLNNNEGEEAKNRKKCNS